MTWQRLKKILADPDRPFVHRDFSWLQFNDRVLAEARESENPLLERLKFLGITASNLDEFYMIRVSSLDREIQAASRSKKISAEKYQRLIKTRYEILSAIDRFHRRQNLCFNTLKKELHRNKVHIIQSGKRVEPDFERAADELFYEYCADYLSEPEHYSSSDLKSLVNLQSIILYKSGKMVVVPKTLQTAFWKKLPGQRFALFYLDDLLRKQLPKVFSLKGPPLSIRIIRDADISVDLEEDEMTSVPDIIKKSIRSRDRGAPVQIQVRGNFKIIDRSTISRIYKIPVERISYMTQPLDLSASFKFANEIAKEKNFNKKKLFYAPFRPIVPKELTHNRGILSQLKQRDYFLHHPYDSFDAYVNFIREAAEDRLVTSIQQTVYRVDSLSPVVETLKQAARTKKVRVLIEPRARFDEMNNVRLAEELRAAGVDVGFAWGKLKLHAKIALITRKQEKKTEYFTHLSTGNYNSKTARLYTDMALFTAHRGIGEDAQNFFDSVSKERIPENFKSLVMAPTQLHKRLINLIRTEIAATQAGRQGRIFAKLNTLVDEKVVNLLYEASQAGVQVDLNIRGACSLVPKIKGLSDNIQVISVIDRFLEHSRIYYFQNSDIIYLSSADWMPRNFFKRLELAFPVLDERISNYIKNQVIPIYLNDNWKAWELTRRGQWLRKRRLSSNPKSRAQYRFIELAEQKYRGTSLGEH